MLLRLLAVLALLAACSPASAEGITVHEMVVGQKVLYVLNSRVLTSASDGCVTWAQISPAGKYVAYLSQTEDYIRLCVVPAAGGDSTVIARRPVGEHVTKRRPAGSWFLDEVPEDSSPIAWSPDEKLILFPAEHVRPKGADEASEHWLVASDIDGNRQATLRLPPGRNSTQSSPGNGLEGTPVWSPEASKVAFVRGEIDTAEPLEQQVSRSIYVFDLAKSEAAAVVSRGSGSLEIKGWGERSRSLRYRFSDGGRTEIWDVSLEGLVPLRISDKPEAKNASPDGSFYVSDDGQSRMDLRSLPSHENVKLGLSENMRFAGWAPGGKLFACTRPDTLHDECNRRNKTLYSLWMVGVEGNMFNTMCAALNADPGRRPTWSRDGLRMCYLCEGRAYLTELAWRKLSPWDKLSLGMELTETEENVVIMDNASIMRDALKTYMKNHNDQWPAPDKIQIELSPYLGKRTDVFFRPGSTQRLFHYFPAPALLPGTTPEKTVIGSFRLRRSKRTIYIFRDWHIEIWRL